MKIKIDFKAPSNNLNISLKMHRNTSYTPRNVFKPNCAKCAKEGNTSEHYTYVNANGLRTVLINAKDIPTHPHPRNWAFGLSLKNVLTEFKNWVDVNNKFINFNTMKEFFTINYGQADVPSKFNRALATCPILIQELDEKIARDNHNGFEARLRGIKHILYASIVRRWFSLNKQLMTTQRDCRMRMRVKFDQDRQVNDMKRRYDKRSGYNKQTKKEKDPKQQQQQQQQKKKTNNNTFRKDLQEKMTIPRYLEFLRKIWESNNRRGEEPNESYAHYAMVSKTNGGGHIKVVYLDDKQRLQETNAFVNQRIFEDCKRSRKKKGQKHMKFNLSDGLICLIYKDEVIQLYNEKDKEDLINSGLIPDIMLGNTEQLVDQLTQMHREEAEEMLRQRPVASSSTNARGMFDYSDSDSDSDSDNDSEESESEYGEDEPNDQDFKQETKMAKWLIKIGEDSDDSSDSERSITPHSDKGMSKKKLLLLQKQEKRQADLEAKKAKKLEKRAIEEAYENEAIDFDAI